MLPRTGGHTQPKTCPIVPQVVAFAKPWPSQCKGPFFEEYEARLTALVGYTLLATTTCRLSCAVLPSQFHWVGWAGVSISFNTATAVWLDRLGLLRFRFTATSTNFHNLSTSFTSGNLIYEDTLRAQDWGPQTHTSRLPSVTVLRSKTKTKTANAIV